MMNAPAVGLLIKRRNFLVGAAAAIMRVRGVEHAIAETMTKNVVLLGDSVLDNAAYVASGSDVLSHLRRLLPAEWSATLLAVDGSVMAGVLRQLERVPADATYLVVSMGGNDALAAASILDAPSTSVGEALLKVWEVKQRFSSE